MTDATDRPACGGPRQDASANRSTAWIARGFEELVDRFERQPSDRQTDFDIVVVGSGYGGAVAAAELAGCTDSTRGTGPISVCVLERGNEYLRGMFPHRMAELAGHVRFSTPGSARPRGNREGLFDIRIGSDLGALVANGLGGGSLINAGVLEIPKADVFSDWPDPIRSALQNGDLFKRAKVLLGAADADGRDNTIECHPDGPPAKFHALRRLSPVNWNGTNPFRPAAISVAMQKGNNAAGTPLKGCNQCGDCMTGCNHGAKDSLDLNLLVQAWSRGADLFTGATVLRIERDVHLHSWLLDVVHTDEKLRKRQGRPLRLRAGKVILAAGCFGSTEILLRSQSEALRFSRRLGQKFSSNGDMIAAAYLQNTDVNAVADEAAPPDSREVGPTITGIIDLRRDAKRGQTIEELAIPAPLRRVFEEIVTTANTLHALGTPDMEAHDGAGTTQDPCAVEHAAIRRTSVFAAMGHDGADGALELIRSEDDDQGDGAIRVRWPDLCNRGVFAEQINVLKRLASESGLGGRVLPNPLWQMLPDDLNFLFDGRHGPPVTVHPLGGCPMGKDSDHGVVDHKGQVFDCAPGKQGNAVHPGLVVLDGSVMPTSLGTNPALTIAAVALSAVEALRTEWNLEEGNEAVRVPPERPVHRELSEASAPRATRVEVVERMTGKAALPGAAGGSVACVIELTLRFHPKSLGELVFPAANGQLQMKRELDVAEGMLRVLNDDDRWSVQKRAGDVDTRETPRMSAPRLEEIVEFEAPLTGKLSLLHREPSTSRARRCRALRAWVWNRGLRDVWQEMVKRIRRDGLIKLIREWRSGKQELRNRLRTLCAVASRAGEARLIEYELTVGQPVKVGETIDPRILASGSRIHGRKQLTYARRSNPWRQLMRLHLDAPERLAAVLELDLKYLAKKGVPLFHIVDQEDQPSALVDLVSFGAYFLRLLASIHALSFRAPDAPVPRRPQRLPGVVCGLPYPEISEIEVDRLPSGIPVRVRLTRYRPPGCSSTPVVMIHGYSASGTTFAHPAVRPGLARHFCTLGRDVWILDLRTSSGMPTARHPWAFEDAACADLPAAFDFVRRATRAPQIDVIAHCVGAAMFSMVVLAPPKPGDRFFVERTQLPHWIRKAVLSQVGPAVVISPTNALRAYVMSYLRQFFPLAHYQFRVEPDPSLADRLFDRLLATLPYPQEEFDVENPPLRFWRRTPFVGTRHRMDALYGRDFNLADRCGPRIKKKVLDRIDDLFGPLSIETVSQGIHFARTGVITNRFGRNEYVSRRNLIERWIFPTMSIHGEENGLWDVATLARLKELFRHVPKAEYETRQFKGFGHQDCLIGADAGQVFEEISEFLG